MNKIPKELEADIVEKYKETYSTRKTAKALIVSRNAVIRVIKACGVFQKINYRHFGLSEIISTRIQKVPIPDGCREMAFSPKSMAMAKSGILHLFVVTEPIRYYSVPDYEIGERLQRLKILQNEHGHAWQIKEISNLRKGNQPNANSYFLVTGDTWQVKLSARFAIISFTMETCLRNKNDIDALELKSREVVMAHANELHKRLGTPFRLNLGGYRQRFLIAQAEMGLVSKVVYNSLKEAGWVASPPNAFGQVWLDKTPGFGIEAGGLDGNVFNRNFTNLVGYLQEHDLAHEFSLLDKGMQGYFGMLIEAGKQKEVDTKQQQSLNKWGTSEMENETKHSYIG